MFLLIFIIVATGTLCTIFVVKTYYKMLQNNYSRENKLFNPNDIELPTNWIIIRLYINPYTKKYVVEFRNEITLDEHIISSYYKIEESLIAMNKYISEYSGTHKSDNEKG